MVMRAETRPRSVIPAAWLDRVIQRGSAWPRWATGSVVALMIAAAWFATYASGGSQQALPHLFYIPIIGASMLYGVAGGLTAALASAVVAGPLMPLDTATGEAQLATGWLIRAVMFCLVAAAATLAIEIRERVSEQRLSTEVRTRMAEAITGSSSPADDEVLAALPRVVAEGLFHTVYQPAYALDDGRLLAVEALTRFDAEPKRTPDVWFEAAAAAGLGTDRKSVV